MLGILKEITADNIKGSCANPQKLIYITIRDVSMSFQMKNNNIERHV